MDVDECGTGVWGQGWEGNSLTEKERVFESSSRKQMGLFISVYDIVKSNAS